MHAMRLVGLLGNRLPQPEVALFGAVAVEAFMRGQVVHGGVHGLNGGPGQRFRHVADAAADQPRRGLRMGLNERIHAPVDFREQISRLQLEEMIVDISHSFRSKGILFHTAYRKESRAGSGIPAPSGQKKPKAMPNRPRGKGARREFTAASCSASNPCPPGSRAKTQ